MDGHKVNTFEDLVHCGAYVVVPLAEAFRDTWYYLPEMAIDTSANAGAGGENGDRRGSRDRAASVEDYGNRPPVG